MRHGIPEFRLPQSVLDAEIARITEMGVTIRCGCEIGNTVTLEALKAEYRAVLLTVGLSKGMSLPLFNDAGTAEIAVDFLKRARGKAGGISVPQSALVIGGGDVAMDVASTLKILGCESVTCVAREELAEFPASEKSSPPPGRWASLSLMALRQRQLTEIRSPSGTCACTASYL